ncbi:gamma tubulin complex protein [Holotrichia oblita]|uniref:Gamma tubulin complex protein n=1 Tax=Holotrichia oblita TaxID=644536 RepID=A0ACB9SLS4_HOLOL|nr:gamma tubulin complex protein [Holotrichia oblita]
MSFDVNGRFISYNYGKIDELNFNVSVNSVYYLLTKLCEKLLTNDKTNNAPNKFLRKCRSKAFEILLSKKIPSVQGDEVLLQDNKDPYCHLLAWEFVLINQHKLAEHACKLEKCVNILQGSNSLNENVLSDILYVLVKLCRLPDEKATMSISSTTTSALQDSIKFRWYDSEKFKLSMPMICSDTKFKNDSFLLQTKRNIKRYEYLRTRYSENDVCQHCNLPVRISCCNSSCTHKEDNKGRSLSNVEENDIWELVSKTEFSQHRTWESLGNSYPEKQPPFLSEASSKVFSNLYNMHACNILQLLGEGNCTPSIIVEQKNFVVHIKHLLVGITSDSFKRNRNGEMYLVSGTTTEGITPRAMDLYCKDLLLCSCCYISLDKLCNLKSTFEDYNNHGFIFKEFCDSINRYLGYYRLAIQNISDNCNLLSIHNHVRPLLSHLTVLASVCKVGPFTESGSLPNGVSLLNYLYQKTVELTDKDVVMVLYSVLYPCIQIYFNRFVQQWIFEGMVNDPYGEFFIVSNSTYLRTRGRTYWTRGHTVRVDMVPDFLGDLTQEILSCGKTVNLLKLCVPNSALCMYLMGKKPNLLSCCLSSDQVSALERSSTCYYLEVMAECGPKFQLSNFIRKTTEQHAAFMNLITEKRAVTLKRLELEKLKIVQDETEKKRKAIAELKSQYDEALQNKKSQLIQRVEEEIKSNEEILRMQNLRQKLIEKETSDLIEYYDKLNEISNQKRKDLQKHIDKLKRNDLDSSVTQESELDDEEESSIQTPITDKFSVEEISSANSNETFTSALSESPIRNDDDTKTNSQETESETEQENCVVASLDDINANSAGDSKLSDVARIAAENFEMARRNRIKVLSEEMGLMGVDPTTIQQRPKVNNKSDRECALSELERNRLRVMSSEFDLHIDPEKLPNLKRGELNAMGRNRMKIMGCSDCFHPRDEDVETVRRNEENEGLNRVEIKETELDKVENGSRTSLSHCDNDNYLNGINSITTKQLPPTSETNGNIANSEVNGNLHNDANDDALVDNFQELKKVQQKNLLNKSINLNLKLDFTNLKNDPVSQHNIRRNASESIFSRFLKSPNFELEKPLPMSLGSTPCLETATPRMHSSIDHLDLESGATTAATNFTDEGFVFNEVKQEPVLFTTKRQSPDTRVLEKTSLSKRVTMREADAISTRAIKIFIQQSVSIPVNTQIGLVNNELLKYLFTDLHFLAHLNSLHNYFFLLDGEFGRNITEGLFEKLHDVNLPVDLINYRTLQHLVYDAIDSSIKLHKNSNCLSFKINSLPKTFNLEDPDVLECLSLSYKVTWPLNILLPSDTIAKYDEVFKFLLKLNRVSWVLKKTLLVFIESEIVTHSQTHLEDLHGNLKVLQLSASGGVEFRRRRLHLRARQFQEAGRHLQEFRGVGHVLRESRAQSGQSRLPTASCTTVGYVERQRLLHEPDNRVPFAEQ